MSTALILSLRESCGYMRDGGYHQTAQLMATAADEIERLNRQIASAADARRPAIVERGALRRPVGSRSNRMTRKPLGTTPRELGT